MFSSCDFQDKKAKMVVAVSTVTTTLASVQGYWPKVDYNGKDVFLIKKSKIYDQYTVTIL